MTKAVVVVSSIPPTIATNDDLYNDCIPSSPLFQLGTYIDVELDVRVETTYQTKVMYLMKGNNLMQLGIGRSGENRRFETEVCSAGATTRKKDRYYFEPVSGSKFKSKYEVGHFLKTGCNCKRSKFNFNCDDAAPCEGKK
ncbi:hypothetical protein KY284_006451 [Solanum tuberosum]|nr:hypothetical protein KY284_006451 [Solanum tuberosum]